MKSIMKPWAFLCVLLFPVFAFAQDAVTNDQFFQFLLSSLGGVKGLSTLGIVYLVVQAIVMFMKTPLFGSLFHNFTGAAKIITVSGLTLILGVLGLMYSDGLTFWTAVLHSSTLAAFSVFLNQLYKQFIQKAD